MIKLENIELKYKDSKEKVLEDINFYVNKGEIVAVIGKNGSGKSCLGRILSGII